ncbi:MAG TPA: sugar ABC transporter permease [Aggregatilineales bacterium]|jgi:multiple sugar transport system permease protein|nr:sugar ABC transporter permease [Aggregatilineales bacterium]
MQAAAAPKQVVRVFGREFSRRRLSELSLLLFMLPAMLLVLVFVFVPTIWAIVISFTNQSLIGPNARNFQFVGFDNYVRLFADNSFWNSLGLSFVFVFASAFLGQFILGLLLAVVLRRAHITAKGLIGGAVLLAWVVPEIVAVYVWASVFNFQSGTANQLLLAFGFERHRWLIDTPMLAIILVNVWRGTAFTMLLFSSALEAIPDELFDAAAVDGASAWQKFRFITVPMIRYTILLDFILITMGTFSVFGLVFAMTAGGPLGRSEIIGVYIYRNAFQYREVGFGSAASVIMLLINLVLAVVYLRLLRIEQGK